MNQTIAQLTLLNTRLCDQLTLAAHQLGLYPDDKATAQIKADSLALVREAKTFNPFSNHDTKRHPRTDKRARQ